MNNLIKSVPAVRRARGNRLYLADNTRLLDLFLDDGYRFLSYQDVKTRTYACNAVLKGLTATYPGLYEKRFLKALFCLLGRKMPALVFPSEAAALHCLCRVFDKPCKVSELWPAPEHAENILVWRYRPFLAVPENKILMFPIPSFRAFSPVVLLFNEDVDYSRALPVYDTNEAGLYSTPSINYYAGTRAIYSLIKLNENGYNEKFWSTFIKETAGLFVNNGPYIYPETKDYTTFFTDALAAGILINPTSEAPSIIPMEYTKGELKKLITLSIEK